MVVIRGRLAPEVGAVVRRALEAALDEQRRAAATREPGEPDPVDEAVGVAPSFGQRQADALGMVAECALAGGLDRGTPGDRYQVVVHVDAATLAEDADVPAGTSPPAYAATGHPAAGADRRTRAGKRDLAGNGRQMRRSSHECPEPSPAAASAVIRRGQAALEEAGGIHVSAATAQRLACDAATVEMQHGPDGQVLDVGRKTRTISPALRRALAARDRQCRFPGCQAHRCDAHYADIGIMRITYGTGRMAGRPRSTIWCCRSPHSTRKLFIVKCLCKFSSHASLVVSLFSNRNLLAHGSPLWNSPVRRD